MSETVIGITAFCGLIGNSFGALFYMLGGRSKKWLRRYVASLIIAVTANITALIMTKWNPYMMALYPLLIIGFSMGYGADTLIMKILRRTLYSFVILLSGLLMAILLSGNAWYLFIIHTLISLTTIFIGIKGIVQAAAEETLICVLLTLPLSFYAFT